MPTVKDFNTLIKNNGSAFDLTNNKGLIKNMKWANNSPFTASQGVNFDNVKLDGKGGSFFSGDTEESRFVKDATDVALEVTETHFNGNAVEAIKFLDEIGQVKAFENIDVASVRDPSSPASQILHLRQNDPDSYNKLMEMAKQNPEFAQQCAKNPSEAMESLQKPAAPVVVSGPVVAQKPVDDAQDPCDISCEVIDDTPEPVPPVVVSKPEVVIPSEENEPAPKEQSGLDIPAYSKPEGCIPQTGAVNANDFTRFCNEIGHNLKNLMTGEINMQTFMTETLGALVDYIKPMETLGNADILSKVADAVGIEIPSAAMPDMPTVQPMDNIPTYTSTPILPPQ